MPELATLAPSDVITQPQFTPTPTVFGREPIAYTDLNFGGPSDITRPTYAGRTGASLPHPTAIRTATVTQTNGADANNNGGVAGVNSGDPLAQAATTPVPTYLVVTATPTLAAIALAPTLTPLATVTAQSNLNLASILQPSTQNVSAPLSLFHLLWCERIRCFRFIDQPALHAFAQQRRPLSHPTPVVRRSEPVSQCVSQTVNQ